MSENTDRSINTKSREEVKEPGLYKVVLHNDDYTTMEFVIEILVSVFRKTEGEASKIMMEVHNKGAGVAGVYPYDIGLTRVYEVKRRSTGQNFPLMCTLEKV